MSEHDGHEDDQHPAKAEVVDASEPRDATVEDFLSGKKPKTESEVFDFGGDIGKVKVHFRAIGRKEYDMMLTKCAPSTKQRAEGSTYNQDEFAPMLLERVVVVPQLTLAQWKNVWNSDDWNRTELGNLFFKAVEVCSVGIDVNPTGPA